MLACTAVQVQVLEKLDADGEKTKAAQEASAALKQRLSHLTATQHQGKG